MTLLKHISYSLFLLSAIFLSACGQKGPLYIQESIEETEQSPANKNNSEISNSGTSSTQVKTDTESKTAPEAKSKK